MPCVMHDDASLLRAVAYALYYVERDCDVCELINRPNAVFLPAMLCAAWVDATHIVLRENQENALAQRNA